ELFETLAVDAVDAAVADMEDVRGGGLDDHCRKRADVALVAIVFVLLAAPRFCMQPRVRRRQHALRRRLYRPGFRRAVVIGEKAFDDRLARDLADLTAADSVRDDDGDALEAQERFPRDERAVKVLVDRFAARVGVLADRDFQFARHSSYRRRMAPTRRGWGPIMPAGSADGTPGRGPDIDDTLGRGPRMRRVEREPGEGEAADQVADDRRDLVPEQVIEPGEVTAQQQARREQEHVHDRVL